MKDGSGLMAKAERFLAATRLLARAGDSESAVSRAYYAAYFVAEALLHALGQSYSSHRAVIAAFGREFAHGGRLHVRFHRLLIRAFEQRQRADYDVSFELAADDVALLLDEVDAFAAEARAWLERQPEPQG